MTYRWLKCDFHTHAIRSSVDTVGHTPEELINRAAELGYEVLAITDHERLTWSPSLGEYSAHKGILLIPGVELTVEGKPLLFLNYGKRPQEYRGFFRSFRKLDREKRPEGLIVAPHPFFPMPRALNGSFSLVCSALDAIEFHRFYTPRLNWNLQAVREARERGLPVMGSSDCHSLSELGTTYSMVQAPKTVEGVVAAIRRGRVQVVSRPLGHVEMRRLGVQFLHQQSRKLLRRIRHHIY